MAALHCGVPTSHGGGSVCSGAQALGDWASAVAARGQLTRSMCNLPRQGIKVVFPALAGGFLTTGPPGKSSFGTLDTQIGVLIFLSSLVFIVI